MELILRIRREACRYQRDRERSGDKERTREKMKTCPTPGVTEASSELKTSQAARPRPTRKMNRVSSIEYRVSSIKLGMVCPSPPKTKTKAKSKKNGPATGLDFEGKKTRSVVP